MLDLGCFDWWPLSGMMWDVRNPSVSLDLKFESLIEEISSLFPGVMQGVGVCLIRAGV
jgi:hypothetical protein